MEATHTNGMSIVVGDEFSKVLFYEDSVGEMGIIDSVLSALCSVFMLTGKHVGKHLDIHIQDCIIKQEEPVLYSGVINISKRMVYYSTDPGLSKYVRQIVSGRTSTFENVPHIHSILDACYSTYAEGVEWTAHSLDDVNDEETRIFKETYTQREAAYNKMDDVFKKVGDILASGKVGEAYDVSKLTASFQKQIDEHNKKSDDNDAEWFGGDDSY